MNTQPACGTCGATEITYTHAAARGWGRILRKLYCGRCVQRFPGWMRAQF